MFVRASWIAVWVAVAGCTEDKLALPATAVAADSGSAAETVAAKEDAGPGAEASQESDVAAAADTAPIDSGEPLDVAIASGPDAAPLHPPGERGVCDPCVASKDCSDPMASCVGLGDPAGAHGWFCQAPCGVANACVEGSHCQARSTAEGQVVLSCVPDSNGCACSAAAAAANWTTPCFSPSFSEQGLVVGKCTGNWTCKAGGCNAKAPKIEFCNGIDDDCDGQIDETKSDKPSDNLCDDGNPCTTGEKCQNGSCDPGVNTECTCAQNQDCAGQNVCKGKWFCDKTTPKWHCNIVPSTAPDCSKLTATACQVVGCDVAKGCALVAKPDGTGCDADGNNCTAADACKTGVCKAGAPVACDDGNPCTFDTCSAKGCTQVATTGSCDDGNACTSSDACKKGACNGTAIACTDGNPCTTDGCDSVSGKCGTTGANNGATCDDSDPCTSADTCQNGTCKGGAIMVCNDGNPCTADSCQAGKGCVTAHTSSNCDDGNACTKGDVCSSGTCIGGPSVCGCQSQKDCDNQQAADPCLGALVCNLVANPPSCVPKAGAAPFCADAGACLQTSCAAGKCTTANKPDATTCNDGNLCTAQDTCKGGACQGVGVSCDDGNPCTVDSCTLNGQSAACGHTVSTGSCSDNNPCTVGDACASGKCSPGLGKDCGDGAACTVDSCDSKSGDCKHDANALQGKVCSSGKGACGPAVCNAAVCTLQITNSCDDGNPCTADSCVADVGCDHAATTLPCDDGNPCTLADSCAATKCKGTKANQCDDGNPCTDDSCATASGCQHANNKVSCNDSDLCTETDSCGDGVCKGKKKNCGDGNPCTVSLCSLGVCSAATNVPDTTPCKGKGSCNGDASCAAGVCVDQVGTCPNKKGREIIPPVIPTVFGKAKTLFDPIGVHEVKLTVAPADWQAYMALVAKQQKGTTWWQAKVEFDGKDYGTTGIRPFGFGSLFTNPQKPNIRVKFDAHVADQTGPDEVHSLRFKPSGQDNSWLKQLLGPMIVQQIGGYASRYSFARMWVNGQPFGLYQMIEHVDKHFYKVNFANNDGNEYQRKTSCMGLNCPNGVCANLASYYIGDPGAATEVVALATYAKSEPEATFPAKLAALVDLDSLFAQYAWEAISSDIDTLAAAGQNYTLYMNQATAKMEFIPTGQDLVLGFKASWYDLWKPWGAPNTWCGNRIDDMYTRIVNNPPLKSQLAATMQKAHCGPFNAKTFVPMILAYKKLLWTDLTQDPKGFLTPAQLDKAYADLIAYVEKRNVYLDTMIGPCP